MVQRSNDIEPGFTPEHLKRADEIYKDLVNQHNLGGKAYFGHRISKSEMTTLNRLWHRAQRLAVKETLPEVNPEEAAVGSVTDPEQHDAVVEDPRDESEKAFDEAYWPNHKEGCKFAVENPETMPVGAEGCTCQSEAETPS